MPSYGTLEEARTSDHLYKIHMANVKNVNGLTMCVSLQ